MAAGTVTITETTVGSMKLVEFQWTSDASGNVNGTFTVGAYSGEVTSIATVPGTSGNQPTTYTISVLDGNGIDLLCGLGTTRSITATEYLKKPLGAVAFDKLQLNISSAGNAKQGTAYLFLR